MRESNLAGPRNADILSDHQSAILTICLFVTPWAKLLAVVVVKTETAVLAI